MKRTTLSMLSIVMLLFAFSGLWAQSKKTIRLNLELGKTYRQESKTVMLITQDIDGTKLEVDMEIAGKVAMQTRSKTDTSYNLTARYESLGTTVSAMGQKQTISSAEKTGLSASLANMVNKDFQLKMNKTGQVYDVQGFSEIVGSALQSIPDAGARQQATGQIKQQFGDKTFASSMNAVSALLPPGPVTVGEHWIARQRTFSVVETMLESDCTLSGEDRDGYDIAVKSLLTTRTDTTFSVNGMDVKCQLSGTANGSFKISKHTGWVKYGQLSSTVSGTITILPNDRVPGGMTVPMTIKTTTTIHDGISGPPPAGP